MKLVLEIDLAGAAIEDGEGSEVALLLSTAAGQVRERGIQDGAGDYLHDSNGNRVGGWQVQEESAMEARS